MTGRLLALLVLLTSTCEVLCLKCHKCPPRVHYSAKACLAGPLETCKAHHTACYFEYEKRDIRLGCGRDWANPAGCYGTRCVTWCTGDKCNADLLRNEAPFELDLDEIPTTGSPSLFSSDWFSSFFTNSASRVNSAGILLIMIASLVMAICTTA